MGLKAKVEAIIYAAEEPITVEQIAALLKDIVLAEEVAARESVEAAAAEAVVEVEIATDVLADDCAPPPEGKVDSEENVPSDPSSVDDSVAPEFAPVPADPSAPSESDEEANAQASVTAPEPVAGKRKRGAKKELTEDGRVIARVRVLVEELVSDYQNEDRGIEVRAVAGGYRMATKPEHHDVVRAFARSLKPPVRLSLAALETLSVIAYKQPVTVPEISEIRGVESGGVIGTLLDRKLITTAGRKQVVGRPILYKTSKEFLLRFGLNSMTDLPSMEEFEKLAIDGQGELFTREPSAAQPVTPLQAELETSEPIEEPEDDAVAEVAPQLDSTEGDSQTESNAGKPPAE